MPLPVDGAVGVPDASEPVRPVPERGANVPWDEHEAEDGVTNGVILERDTTVGTIAAESSGRSAVRLEDVGDHVEIVAMRAANSVVVRYVIPDAPTGGGIDATLSVYVNGERRERLRVTSRYSWFYDLPAWSNGGPDHPAEDPARGAPFHYYDESHALVGDIRAGATVRIQLDEGDADWAVVDLVDLELVAPPRARPEGLLSLTEDCGAVANDDGDDGAAIQGCLDRARAMGGGVWIPPGVFEARYDASRDMGFFTAEVRVEGAGMWHSTIRGSGARFYCAGDRCRFSDFALFGDTRTRDGQKRSNGFNGSGGSGSRLDRIWIEHVEVGYWVGLDSAPNGPTDGLVVSEVRIRNTFADGINFCNGTSRSEVVQSHFRYTGDDAIAVWPYTSPGAVGTDDVLHFNTAQLPWRANCFAIYGGSGHRVEDSVCADTLTFPGIQVGGPYPSHAFSGTTRIARNTLIRAGGQSFSQEHGALKLVSFQSDTSGVVVEDVDIVDPTYSGLDFSSWGDDASRITGASFARVRIGSAGRYGIQVRGDARGGATLEGVLVEGAASGGLSVLAPEGAFALMRGGGNVGW